MHSVLSVVHLPFPLSVTRWRRSICRCWLKMLSWAWIFGWSVPLFHFGHATSQTANLSDHNQRSRRQQVGDCVSGYWRWNDWSEWSACNNQGCNQQDLRTRIRFCPDNPGENETESELCAEAPHCNPAMAPTHPKVEEAKSDSLSLSVALEALLGMFIILVAAFTIYTVVTVIQRRRKEAKEEQTDISDRLSDEDANKAYSFVSDTQGMIEMSSAPFATDVPADVIEMTEFSATPSAAGTASYAQGMPDWLVAPSTSTVAASEGSGWDFEVDPVESESEIK